jgi:hypothetical protein
MGLSVGESLKTLAESRNSRFGSVPDGRPGSFADGLAELWVAANLPESLSPV